jgi:hypothetical protein
MQFDLTTLHGWLRLCHVLPGFVGLIAFWFPVFAKKGKRVHVLVGKLFAFCCLTVVISATISSIWAVVAPMSFLPNTRGMSDQQLANAVDSSRFFGWLLGPLSLFTFIPLVFSLQWLKAKNSPTAMQSGWLRSLVSIEAILCIAMIFYGWQRAFGTGANHWWAIFGIGVAGLTATYKHCMDTTQPAPYRMQWWYRHMEYMLTTGIAFHTAFLVFGVTRIFGSLLTGYYAVLPWILPSVIGVPAILFWVAWYRRKFNDERIAKGV